MTEVRGFKTAGELKKQCEIDPEKKQLQLADAYQVGSCRGFIEAYLQIISGTPFSFLRKTDIFKLFKEGLTVGQIMDAFLLYMAKHPENENNAALIVLDNCLMLAGLLKATRVNPDSAKDDAVQ
jgi:hypothetical protein